MVNVGATLRALFTELLTPTKSDLKLIYSFPFKDTHNHAILCFFAKSSRGASSRLSDEEAAWNQLKEPKVIECDLQAKLALFCLPLLILEGLDATNILAEN